MKKLHPASPCLILPYLILTIQLFIVSNITAQNVVNNGGNLVVNEGAYIVIGGNYINKNDGVSDGRVHLDGNIILKRNWVNLSNNDVLVNVGSGPAGNVIMNGSLKQYIEGYHSSRFENLILQSSEKTLNISGCSVHDTLKLDAVFDLNRQKIIIENPSPASITWYSGYILSETNSLEGYGRVEWKIGDSTGSYRVPFGSGITTHDDLSLVFTTIIPGSEEGSVVFSTYPTGCQNIPLPGEVPYLDRSFEYIADRYWIIEPRYEDKPGIDITFHYTNADVNNACNGGLDENKLKAMRYNTLLNTWNDLEPTGSGVPGDNKFATGIIQPSEFFAPWILIDEVIDWEIYFANSFTPDDDGINDFFGPIGYNLDRLNVEMFIYNRWGNLICKLNNPDLSWDGRYNNKPCEGGVYSWIAFITEANGKSFKYKGIVTLLR